MRFTYNARKAAQSAAYLVRLNGGTMDVYALIKLLYLADRKALLRRGRPITGDAMVSMPLGPVLSRIYDESKSPSEIQNEFWSELFTARENNLVSLKAQGDPAVDELSEYERGIIAETHAHYGRYDFGHLKSMTHNLPEFRDPEGSSIPIDPVAILKEEGWTEEEIDEALMSAREELFFNKVCQ